MILAALFCHQGAGWLISMFMENENIVAYGTRFLQGFSLALPFLALDFLAVGVFQACGLGKNALIFAIMRKIVLEIPALCLLNWLFPLYGLAYAQLTAEVVLCAAAIFVLRHLFQTLENRQGGRRAAGGCLIAFRPEKLFAYAKRPGQQAEKACRPGRFSVCFLFQQTGHSLGCRRPGIRPHRFQSSLRRLLWPIRDRWAFLPAPAGDSAPPSAQHGLSPKNLDVLCRSPGRPHSSCFRRCPAPGPSSSQPSERLCRRSYRRAPAGWKRSGCRPPAGSGTRSSGTSPVPGGISTNRKSTSSQITSCQNCLTAPAITGPRQTTGALLVFQQQVDAHDVDTGAALDRVDAVLAAGGRAVHPKQLGDGRAGDYRRPGCRPYGPGGASPRPAWRWSCFGQRRLCRKQRR